MYYVFVDTSPNFVAKRNGISYWTLAVIALITLSILVIMYKLGLCLIRYKEVKRAAIEPKNYEMIYMKAAECERYSLF